MDENITVKRTGSDSAELRYGNDDFYLQVRRVRANNKDVWRVYKVTEMSSTRLTGCTTATQAIEYAKDWLTKGRSQLDAALNA